MQIQEITKSMAMKLNMGNYENIDIFTSMRATVAENEPLREASEKLEQLVLQDLMEQKEMVEGLSAKELTFTRPTRR